MHLVFLVPAGFDSLWGRSGNLGDPVIRVRNREWASRPPSAESERGPNQLIIPVTTRGARNPGWSYVSPSGATRKILSDYILLAPSLT